MADRTDASSAKGTEPSDGHWQWRWRMAQRIVERCDFAVLGVVAIYLIGSTKDGTAGPGSDLDLLIHYDGTASSRALIESYLRGWGHALAEWNQHRTGIVLENLLEPHFITDADIQARTSFAAMIESHTNRARLLGKRD